MRIMGITLRDYRGTTDREVSFAPTGVTVVEGPNEIGKSSIPEAIDHLFDDLDSSTRRDLQAVRPVGQDVGPEVIVEVETGAYAFRFRKRFLRQPITELQVHRPHAEQLSGRAAHDRVQTILRETVDLGLWKALRVRQGDLVSQASLATGRSLADALDRAAGEAPTGDEEHSLYDAAHAEYLHFWTETGRRKQEEAALERASHETTQEIERIRGALDAIEADVESSLELRTQARCLTEQRGDLRVRVDELQARVDALTILEAGVAAAEARHETARLVAESARGATDSRLAAVAGLGAAITTHARLEEASTHDAARLASARAAVTAADSALAAARAQRDRARATAEATQERHRRARDAAELADLEERYARGRAANVAMTAATTDADLPMTTQAIATIREHDRAVELARARLDAARPQVRVTAVGDVEAAMDGHPLRLAPGEQLERRVERGLRIDLPGVASILVTAGTATDDQTADLERAQARLAASLRAAGAADVADAEALHARREAAARTIDEQGRLRASVLQGTSASAMAARIVALRDLLAGDHPLAETDHPADLALDAAQRDLDIAERASRAAEEAWDAARRAHLDVEVAASRRETATRMAAEDVARRETELAEARAVVSDETLASRATDAETAERRAAAEVAAGREELLRQGPAEARLELADGKRSLDAIDVQIRLVQDRLLEVTTRLRDHGEDGLAEDLAEAQAAHDHHAASLRRYQAQAAARRLLFETLREERDRTRRSYVGPLRVEIERLGRLVFGSGFSVELDEQTLEVEDRTLDGRTIPFGSLSIGAQEQIAIIGRLACATIVAPEGGVPVILDDALGNSDPMRLAAMAQVLAAAGEQSQIIVLTCQPDRYAHLDAATVVRLT